MLEAPVAGLFLHASAVVVDGGAVLFLGHSTAGKSTIARMLGPTFPALADDAVYAAKDAAGGWRVVEGGFRFEDGDIYQRIQEIHRQIRDGKGVPLRACFRLRKAEQVRLIPVPPVELARYLADAALEVDLQRKTEKYQKSPKIDLLALHRQWFHWVAEIARSHSGWMLCFSITSDKSEICDLIQEAVQL